MNKKGWSVLLSATMGLGLLAGCGGGDKDATSTTGASSSPGAATSSVKPKDPVTIKFHTHGTEAQYNWKQTLEEFNKANPDIKVELVTLSEKGDTAEATKKLDLAAASGEQMDVLMFSDPASYAQRVGLGMVEPIDSFITKDGYKVPEEYKVDTVLNGKYYALPGKFNPWYVLLNKDHLKEAGLTVPTDWTWDEFADYAKKLTKGDGATKRYGTYFHGPQGGGWMEFLKLNLASQEDNVDFIKADGTSNLDNPMFKKTLELRAKMEKEDKSSVPYSEMLSQKLHYRTQFFNQSASMILIGSWMNSELGGTDQNDLTFNVAVAPYPKNTKSDKGGFTPVTTDFMAVAATSKHKQEAYRFIRWYTTEGLAKFGRNIPSWNKVKADDLGKITTAILSGTKHPEKVDKASLDAVLTASKSSKIIPPVVYQAEVFKVINSEYELFILDKQNLDTTLKNMQEKVNKIIASNKK
ncbi:ABC transporter substrate-binding protein [Gorillibacterium sp. sgz5001074]|uniref:ABC transporter substrate-binding protein n=1 Tax=Gorillibacterium sp. sgz5001074 TaxID=3446695 RepID=UPI003F66BA3F